MNGNITGWLWLLAIGFLAAAAISALRQFFTADEASREIMEEADDLLREKDYRAALKGYRRVKGLVSAVLEPDLYRYVVLNTGYCYEMMAMQIIHKPARCMKLLQQALDSYHQGFGLCSPEDDPADYAHICFNFAHAMSVVYVVEQQSLAAMESRSGAFGGAMMSMKHQVRQHILEALRWYGEAEVVCRKYNNRRRLTEILENTAVCHRDAWNWGLDDSGLDKAMTIWAKMRQMTQNDDVDAYALAGMELANDLCRRFDARQSELTPVFNWMVAQRIVAGCDVPLLLATDKLPHYEAETDLRRALKALEESLEAVCRRESDLYESQLKKARLRMELAGVHGRLAMVSDRMHHLERLIAYAQTAWEGFSAASGAVAKASAITTDNEPAADNDIAESNRKHAAIDALLCLRWTGRGLLSLGQYTGNMELMRKALALWDEAIRRAILFAPAAQLLEDGQWLCEYAQGVAETVWLMGAWEESKRLACMTEHMQTLYDTIDCFEKNITLAKKAHYAISWCQAQLVACAFIVPELGAEHEKTSMDSLNRALTEAFRSVPRDMEPELRARTLALEWRLWQSDERFHARFTEAFERFSASAVFARNHIQSKSPAPNVVLNPAVYAGLERLMTLAISEQTGREMNAADDEALYRRSPTTLNGVIWGYAQLASLEKHPSMTKIESLEALALKLPDVSYRRYFLFRACLLKASLLPEGLRWLQEALEHYTMLQPESLPLHLMMDSTRVTAMTLFPLYAQSDNTALRQQALRCSERFEEMLRIYPQYSRSDWQEQLAQWVDTEESAHEVKQEVL